MSNYSILKVNNYIVDLNKPIIKSNFDTILKEIKPTNSIAKDKNDNEVIFFIDAPAIRNDGNRSEVEIVIWLRILGFNNPIIIQNLLFKDDGNDLKRILEEKSNNLILSSKGVYLFRSIDDNQILSGNYNYSDKIAVKRILRSYIDIVNIKHEDANWWALYRLITAHNLFADKITILNKVPIGTKLIKKMDEIIFNIHSYMNSSGTNFKNLTYKTIKLEKALNIIRSTTPVIFYIDDHANDGYGELLTSIIYGKSKKKIEIINPIADNPNIDLFTIPKKNKSAIIFFNMVKSFLIKNRGNIDLVIMDLRLFKKESVLNYIQLTSVLLNKLIKENLPHINTIFFTSSDNLFQYKNILFQTPYQQLPKNILIKESFEHNLSAQNSIDNYVEFVYELSQLLNLKKKKKSAFDLSIKEDVDGEANLKKLLVKGLTDKDIENKYLEDFDLVIFDTNYFLSQDFPDKLVRLFKSISQKSIIHITVYYELMRISIVEKDNIKRSIAIFYLALFDLLNIELDISNLTQADKDIIDAIENNDNIKIDLKNWADDHLVELVKSITDKNILFISNDKSDGIRGVDKSGKPGPILILKEFIQKNSVKNITLMSVKQFANVTK